MTLVEICVETVEGVRAAHLAGADRVELCEDLSCGGLTAPLDRIRLALPEAPCQGIAFLVRSRPGNFVYSREEIEEMCSQIHAIREVHKSTKVEKKVPISFVVGALDSNGHIDLPAAQAFAEASRPNPVVFHRAFDEVSDQGKALAQLAKLGYHRVLTTGGHPSKAQPIQLTHLRQLAAHLPIEGSNLQSKNDEDAPTIAILASGGLRSSNVAALVRASGATQVHMRAPGSDGVSTDQNEIEAILAALRAEKLL